VATLQQQATASQQQVARLQAAVTQLQAVVATMPSTIPANLTALSNAHSTNGGVYWRDHIHIFADAQR